MSEIIDKIKKDYGIEIVQSGDQFLSKPKQVIPFSPCLDMALGGGVPEGSWMILGGLPKIGKTYSALSFAANAQRPENGGRPIRVFNIEHRIKEMNLKGTKGLQLTKDKFLLIGSSEEKILSTQDYLALARDMMTAEKQCVYIFDSFSLMADEKERTEGIGTATMGKGSQLLAQFCRLMAPIVDIKRHIVIGIVHLMANIGSPYGGTTEKSGNALKYQVDIKLIAKKFEYLEKGEKNVGQKICWNVVCNALGAPPATECYSTIRYGIGIDRITEIIDVATDLFLIRKSGAWLWLDYLKDHLDLINKPKWDDEVAKEYKAHGSENLYALFEQNPKWVDVLYGDIKKMLGK